MTAGTLQHRRARVLITRPTNQQANFSERCRALGLDPIGLPCVDIVPVDAKLTLDDMQDAKRVLFTSRNAVDHAHRQLALPWSTVAVLAIGKATALSLERHGQTLAHPPVAPYTSEAFLNWLESHAEINSLMIIKGIDGRELIETTLRERGCVVSTRAVYRRKLPSVNDAQRKQVFVDHAPDIVSTTSDEILHNLMAIAGPMHAEGLRRLPLLVNSDRAAALAANMGFQQPAMIARPPGDDGQLHLLRHWIREQTSPR